jgi:hypothetical protein
MEYELALRRPNESTASVLPLRLAYRHETLLVLDNKGGLAHFAEDWNAANDNELKAIQDLLVEAHPTEIEDDIKAHAPWLSAGGGMKVGSRLSLYGVEVTEEAVVFDYPDQSQMAVTALSIHIPPVTFSPEDGHRRLWGQFGRA